VESAADDDLAVEAAIAQRVLLTRLVGPPGIQHLVADLATVRVQGDAGQLGGQGAREV
jgi:hypothetical protein